MKWIYDLSYEDLKDEIIGRNFKSFVVDQVFSWLYAKNCQEINQWSNISKVNQCILMNLFNTSLNKLLSVNEDQEGTKKFLIGLQDNYKIEAVLIKEKPHYTCCISTQVGCALGCKFCATGRMGFKRNLSPGEIVSQVLLLKKYLNGYKGKINIVFMGMGEPLLNYENLEKALKVITSDKGIAIAPRHICLSTAGILSGIKRLERDFPKIKLSFSLNASDGVQREKLMPVTHKNSLESIISYFKVTKKKRKFRVTFEYVLLNGINDSLSDAKKIASLIKEIPCKINLIPFNECPGLDFQTPSEKRIDTFSQYLFEQGFTVMVRRSKGRGINSACGQLVTE